ncbi:MAG TPA: GNAT family N-acetyltransferase [Rugosimonospora sp.]|nr:GNAT family N-acetyltransferase [Rugosimonospora sp.]
MIGPPDIGFRVVVRRLVGVRDGRPSYTDVVGTLLDFGEYATVQARTGTVAVPVSEIAAAKRVPPRATPTGAEIAALERIASAAWPAPHTARLGEWQLRAAGGWTGRANSALPLGDPGLPLDAALAEVAAWYAAQGLPARINVPLPLRADLDRALDERGWLRSPRTLVLAGPLPTTLDGTGVALAERPDADWLRLMAGVKGEPPEVAYAILTGPEHVRFAAIRDAGGALLAIGRGALGDGHLHLALIQVVRPARRQGLARRVIGALAGWAAVLGAHRAYLQVEEANDAAVTLYRRLGLTTHHSYFTRERTAPPHAAARGSERGVRSG